MDKQFKKNISILFALLIGVGVVFVAWKSEVGTHTKESSSFDNTENWRSTLNVVPQSESIRTLSATGKDVDLMTTEATTTTTAIAKKLLIEYASSQEKSVDGSISDTEATRIANLLAQGVAAPQEKIYSLKDLSISSDNSREATITYVTKVNALTKDLLATNEKENDEIAIVTAAMKANDQKLLNKLTLKATAYQQLIEKLLEVKTPSLLSDIHLHLVATTETLRSATDGLENSLVDPAMGISALAKFKNGMDELLLVKEEYRKYFVNY